MHATNPLQLQGLEFLELVSPDPDALHALLLGFGFSRTRRHKDLEIHLYEQGEVRILVNREPATFGERFMEAHGPSISSLAFRVEDAVEASRIAAERGASVANEGDYDNGARKLPAVYGVGDSLIYLVDDWKNDAFYERAGFVPLKRPELVRPKGLVTIDHLTNNVRKGTMETLRAFYKNVFGFTDVRNFEIHGTQTGLTSYALRSPCGTFCIPINEADEARSQINEFIEEYRGPGIQHVAFLTRDLLGTLAALDGTGIETLDIAPAYYDSAFLRVPTVREDREAIQHRSVLVDGDEQGYLLQIFTKNVIGPVFIELIQRENHASFGEGNFQALFDSIERDQRRRGYLT